MSEIEQEEHQSDEGMTPQTFADINIQALKKLLNESDAQQAMAHIRELQSDPAEVSRFVAGVIIANHQRQAFADTVAEILESRSEKA